MLTQKKPITIQFRLLSEWVELIIGIGLFTGGAIAGGHFLSVRDLFEQLSSYSINANIGTMFLFAVLCVSWAASLHTTFPTILFFMYLMVNYCLRQCARLESQLAKGPWTRAYEMCGQHNYTGNPWIVITRAIVIIIDPMFGFVCGSAIASQKSRERLYTMSISFILFTSCHIMLVFLRSDYARHKLKQSTIH